MRKSGNTGLVIIIFGTALVLSNTGTISTAAAQAAICNAKGFAALNTAIKKGQAKKLDTSSLKIAASRLGMAKQALKEKDATFCGSALSSGHAAIARAEKVFAARLAARKATAFCTKQNLTKLDRAIQAATKEKLDRRSVALAQRNQAAAKQAFAKINGPVCGQNLQAGLTTMKKALAVVANCSTANLNKLDATIKKWSQYRQTAGYARNLTRIAARAKQSKARKNWRLCDNSMAAAGKYITQLRTRNTQRCGPRQLSNFNKRLQSGIKAKFDPKLMAGARKSFAAAQKAGKAKDFFTCSISLSKSHQLFSKAKKEANFKAFCSKANFVKLTDAIKTASNRPWRKSQQKQLVRAKQQLAAAQKMQRSKKLVSCGASLQAGLRLVPKQRSRRGRGRGR